MLELYYLPPPSPLKELFCSSEKKRTDRMEAFRERFGMTRRSNFASLRVAFEASPYPTDPQQRMF